MLRLQVRIISDRAPVPSDWHDLTGHHRYYGSSACNGGERIVEARSGPRPYFIKPFGF